MESKSLKEKVLEKWAGLRMAEEAVMVDDLSELLQINREMVKSHNRTHLENYEDGEMGSIHVGDVVTNSGETAKRGVGKGLLTTLVLGALAGGGGLGFFGPMLLGGDGGAATNADSDTRYNLGLGKPDGQESEDEVPESKGKDQGR